MVKASVFIFIFVVCLFVLYGMLGSWSEAAYILILLPILELILWLLYPEYKKASSNKSSQE